MQTNVCVIEYSTTYRTRKQYDKLPKIRPPNLPIVVILADRNLKVTAPHHDVGAIIDRLQRNLTKINISRRIGSHLTWQAINDRPYIEPLPFSINLIYATIEKRS